MLFFFDTLKKKKKKSSDNNIIWFWENVSLIRWWRLVEINDDTNWKGKVLGYTGGGGDNDWSSVKTVENIFLLKSFEGRLFSKKSVGPLFV